MSIPPKKKRQVKKSRPNSARKNKKEQQHIKILEDDYILIEPDRLDIWEMAGFAIIYSIDYFDLTAPGFNSVSKIYLQKHVINEVTSAGELQVTELPEIYRRYENCALIPQSKINLHTLYKAEGECEFYKASFFGGEIATQLIPLFELPKFLEAQILIDDEQGKFYDLINIRENGRAMWGTGDEYSGLTFRNMAESAEELLMRLMEYKRKGALIGEGGSFEYIQVCYIILE